MSSPGHLSILVVEDDPSVRQTLVDMLEINGFRVLQAEDGIQGVEVAQTEQPDLIITDINMPRMSGFELLTRLRADDLVRATPIIVITAKVDRAATRQGMELGADDFITKPFTEDEVIHSIRARLERKELLDELDAFAHTVAHDLKNPLATLGGRLGLLGMTLETADLKSMRRNVDQAVAASNRLASIIDELLVLAGVRRQQVRSEPLDMAAAVKEATERLEVLLAESEAKVQLPANWPPACGHLPWVVHVWTNYISNAAKYGGPKAQITLGGELAANGTHSRFWVRDQGSGLDASTQATLFVPFTRISTARAKGHGLGLSIVRRIVDKLGGAVGVESTPGAGACFWFELPREAPPPRP